MLKKKRLSSKKWLNRHFKDKYVKQSHIKGLYSRAWFKLEEIQKKDKLLKTGMTVIDLGASPGSWSQYTSTQIGNKGHIIACDILPIKPIIGINFLQGDFTDPIILYNLLNIIGKKNAHVVLSDVSPNISGISIVDISKSIYLMEKALNICKYVLMSGGSFLVKIFQGKNFEEDIKKIKSIFTKIKIRKPNASRINSCEIYILATGYKL